jgi:hypothetical protein
VQTFYEMVDILSASPAPPFKKMYKVWHMWKATFSNHQPWLFSNKQRNNCSFCKTLLATLKISENWGEFGTAKASGIATRELKYSVKNFFFNFNIHFTSIFNMYVNVLNVYEMNVFNSMNQKYEVFSVIEIAPQIDNRIGIYLWRELEFFCELFLTSSTHIWRRVWESNPGPQ